MAPELVPNGRFRDGKHGALPAGWAARSPRPGLAPRFGLAIHDGARVLRAAGNGRDDCVGTAAAPVTMEGGQTYRLRVRFSTARGLDPHRCLVFGVAAKTATRFNHGIFRFWATPGARFQGESRFLVPGSGTMEAEVRVTFRGSAKGTAWIESVSLQACDPVAPRPVNVACTRGQGTTEQWAAALDEAGRRRADIALLPEMMNGTTRETMAGPSATVMREKAREHRMYVAGGIYFHDRRVDRVCNRALLFDRGGRLVGTYDKVHPYTPEVTDEGISAGTEVPVFDADFGRVGIMICYDSWFTDVAELLGLRGAELVLFPNAGYYRSLMPARAADNGIRIAASTLYDAPGIWDTAGRDVQAPAADPTVNAHDDATFAAPETTTVGPIGMLFATLDLSRSPSPHNWGGPMLSAPGGRRNRREQRRLLWRDIEDEARGP